MNKILSENSELRLAAETLAEQKAEDIVLIDVRKMKTLPYDYVLIATCKSEVQMHSVLTATRRALKAEGVQPLREEYTSGVRWGVLDVGDFMVHIFEKKTREYYSLERLWADVPVTALEGNLSPESNKKTDNDDSFL